MPRDVVFILVIDCDPLVIPSLFSEFIKCPYNRHPFFRALDGIQLAFVVEIMYSFMVTNFADPAALFVPNKYVDTSI